MAIEQRPREQAEKYTEVVTKAWEDPAFKQRLLGDPRAVLQEHGLMVPAGTAVQVVEGTAETMYLALPTKPAAELSDEQLARLAGEGEGPARKVGQLLIKVWEDPTFKRRLVADPRAVLQEHGLPLPDGQAVRVVEDTAETVHLILPPKPAEGELSDEQLEQVTGGMVGLLIFGGAMLAVAAGWCWADS
jgi:hypothetical protein